MFQELGFEISTVELYRLFLGNHMNCRNGSARFHRSKLSFVTLFDRFSGCILLGYTVLISMFLLIQSQNLIPIRHLTRDPLVLAEKPFYFGALSNVGILLWTASASICLLTFLIFKVTKTHRELQSFFLGSGLLTTLLMLDDLFMLHEEVFPKYLHFQEKFVYLSYLILVALYLIRFRKVLMANRVVVFGISLALFGFSVVADGFMPKGFPGQDSSILWEDGAKLVAIFTWLMYYLDVSLSKLQSTIKGNLIN